MPGPVPKAEHELTRSRKRRGGADLEKPITVGVRRPITQGLQADPNWHPIAKYIWEAAHTSGQFDYYQDSDVAMLYNICEEISVYKQPKINHETGEEYHKRSGQMFASVMSAMQNLLLTEGDRRKVRMELREQVEERPDLKVVAMSQYAGVADAG